MGEIVRTTEPRRELKKFEVADMRRYAIVHAAAKTDEQARADLGDHRCGSGTGSTDVAAIGDEIARGAERLPLDDARLVEWVHEHTLRGRFLWSGALGWMRWDGRRWKTTSEPDVLEEVRQAVIDLHRQEVPKSFGDTQRLRALTALLTEHRIRALTRLARGLVLIEAAEFDNHPDLLNVGNGVVELNTGNLCPHDPDLLLTRYTPTNYVRGATHPDWQQALEALPAESQEWMRLRFGQAATGHPTPDDILPVQRGGGQNGKSTVLAPIHAALGEHAIYVPERVLLCNPGDHPTELTTLRGARLAILEETPETRQLNVKRLKDLLGTEQMTARQIAKDTISWAPTHSLILASNYRPRVDETDYGTWRRLALVEYPFTFVRGAPTAAHERQGDPSLRSRLVRGDQGRHEAVLAWIVGGALDWYRAGQTLPPKPTRVESDTQMWRHEADVVLSYATERLVADPGRHIISTELFNDFNAFLAARGHRAWSDQTFGARFGGHEWASARGIIRKQTLSSTPGVDRGQWLTATPKRYQAWHGVRFRSRDDDEDDELKGQVKASVQGVQGALESFS